MKTNEILVGIEMYLRAVHNMDISELEAHDARGVVEENTAVLFYHRNCVLSRFDYPVYSIEDLHDFCALMTIKLQLQKI